MFNLPVQQEVARPALPATSSARIETRSQSAPFTPAGNTPAAECKSSDQNTPAEHSGSGYELPEIDNVRWEDNPSGGFEAWYAMPGAQHRREKTYLGYLGKRQIVAWEKEPPERFQALVVNWIAEKRQAKGI